MKTDELDGEVSKLSRIQNENLPNQWARVYTCVDFLSYQVDPGGSLYFRSLRQMHLITYNTVYIILPIFIVLEEGFGV